MYVEIKFDKNHFECNLTHRFTRIHDDSETGKTTIANMLSQLRRNNVSIECKLPVIYVRDASDIIEDSILFIDEENISYIGYEIVCDYIKNTQSYFVVISRYDFNNIPYSVDCIKKLYTYGNKTTLVNAYPKFYTDSKISTCDEYYIEDSTSGKIFFDKLLDNLQSINGKDNLEVIPKTHTHKFLIIDRCGFGSSINALVSREDFKDYIHVLDYESFEYFILDYLKEDIPSFDCCFNMEECYHKYLCTLLKHYSKTTECKCFSNCNCSNSNSCKYKMELVNAKKVISKSMYGGCFQ